MQHSMIDTYGYAQYGLERGRLACVGCSHICTFSSDRGSETVNLNPKVRPCYYVLECPGELSKPTVLRYYHVGSLGSLLGSFISMSYYLRDRKVTLI